MVKSGKLPGQSRVHLSKIMFFVTMPNPQNTLLISEERLTIVQKQEELSIYF